MANAVRTLTPNWFASVMGTGIVANALILLPIDVPGRRPLALVFWLLAAGWLAVLVAGTALHWRRHPTAARGHADDPAMAPFYGAPAMALMTVGAGALLVGKDLVGLRAAVAIDWSLWSAGTLLGLFVAGWVPYLLFTRHAPRLEHAFAGWLMPVVPPMVSAATGAGLIAHLPAGQARLALLFGCYAMFGISLIASLVVITLVWAKLALHGPGPAKAVPTLWIVLGPLGQSVTAVNLLGAQAAGVVPAPLAGAMRSFGVLYGVPVWGFAMVWLAIALSMALHTARGGLPFSLAFWSFTFPVGTTVTGTAELSVHTGLHAFTWAAGALFALLVAGWVLAALHTARRSVDGRLFAPPTPVAA